MFALRQLVKNGLKLNVRNGQRNNLTILLFHDILLMSYLAIDEVISFVGHNLCFRNLVTSLHIVCYSLLFIYCLYCVLRGVMRT